MSVKPGIGERFMLPRWRSFHETRRIGELKSPVVGSPDGAVSSVWESMHDDEVAEFVHSPGLHQASDILDRTINGDRPFHGVEPVLHYIDSSSGSTAEMMRLAAGVRRVAGGLDIVPTDELQPFVAPGKVASGLRARLRLRPRNPVLWMDLALAQTVGGNLEKARRSVLVALQLAPHSRFVLRSAARFYVHIDEFDLAWQVLSAPAKDSGDPWIRAAEIAVSDVREKTSKNISAARLDLRMGRYSLRQLSELACAIASHEIEAGQEKAGRRLMDLALKEPTENSVAQAEHESQRSRVIVPDEILAQDGRFEAQAVDFGSRSQWSEAVAAAEHWQNDQPFASDPAMYLSYLASVGLEDYETAERAAQRGLVANPQNPTLANNLAFSLANLGKLEEARNTLERIPISMLDRHDVSVRQATAGLIAFRSGKLNEGRTLYRSALVDGRGDLSPEQLALAYAYWFREEARAETADAPSIGKSARQAITVARSDDARAVFNRVVLGQSGFPFAR